MTITLKNFIKNEGNILKFMYKGYNAQILRDSETGHLNGFIQLSNNHPLNVLDIDAIESMYDGMLPAHGGLQYSGRIIGSSHKTIGFECNHLGDLLPIDHLELTLDHSGYFRNELNHTYKDMEYVKENIMDVIDFIERTELNTTSYVDFANYERVYA